MRIQNKLFATFVVFSLLLVAISLGLVQLGLNKGMMDYVNAREKQAMQPAVEQLQSLYERYGDWEALRGNHRLFQQIIGSALNESGILPEGPMGRNDRPRRPPPRDGRPPPRREPPPGQGGPRPGKRPTPGPVSHAILDADKNLIIGHYPSDRQMMFSEIIVDETIVGYLSVTKRTKLVEEYELSFVEQLQKYIWLIGAGLVFISALLTLPLSRHLTRPLRHITANMRNLATGHYAVPQAPKRDDELGILSRDVNELAKTLQQNQQARQRWLADVSHELRTPVAVLQAQMDAMLDGIRPLDKEQLESASEEVQQLQRLIDDLHELARTDLGEQRYRKIDFDLCERIPKWLERHKGPLSDRGIKLTFESNASSVNFYGDPHRLQQLFDNLLSNTEKYATGADQVSVILSANEQSVTIKVEDNGQGVPTESLPLLFDHLYRVEKTDEALPAGSGIGLAICKKIVEAHNGEIEPFQSTLGGLGISIRFK